MSTHHLSAFEQEEYLLDQKNPTMLRHLSECADCRAAIAKLQHGIGIYREAAVTFSAHSLAARPKPFIDAGKRPATHRLRWAMAAMIPIVLLLLALVPSHLSSPRPAHPAAQISDDALLDQVDEQLSVVVPSPMESLTHLVSSNPHAAKGTKSLVQTN